MPIYNLIYNLKTEKNATYPLGEIDMPYELRVGDICIVSNKIIEKIREVEPCINLVSKFKVKEVIYSIAPGDDHNTPIDIKIERQPQKVSPWPTNFQQWTRLAIGASGLAIFTTYSIGKIEFETMVYWGSTIAFLGYIIEGLLKNINERTNL